MKANLQGIGMTSLRTRERLVTRLRAAGIVREEVLAVIRETPRHIFVDEALSSRAYEDTALPISYGQTISQPYVVARMTEALLARGPLDRVLEVGTGCGYQTAVLARLVKRVYTVERIAAFISQARERFYLLGLHNIKSSHSDGTWGWPEYAPFDGILVTAAPRAIPIELCAQLAEGGTMVIPVGGQEDTQQLTVITRRDGELVRERLEAVSFVPMLGGVQ